MTRRLSDHTLYVIREELPLSLTHLTHFKLLVSVLFQIKQTIAFMIIMAVIQGWYSVSFYSLLYPNSDFSWAQMENILSNGYWILFGELNLDSDTCKNMVIFE